MPLSCRTHVGLGFLALACATAGAEDVLAQARVTVTGRVAVMDRGDRLAEDVGQAVVWLTPVGPAPAGTAAPPAPPPAPADMVTEGKQFLPHVLVVSVGSTITFPNHDPFNHNVFSLSDEGRFDLGLYGRGEGKSHQFEQAGVVRVYCNVHATMSGFILVRETPYYAQPGGDGSFTIPEVPPGAYTLHAWHERAREVSRPVTVSAAGNSSVSLELDARGYKFKPHLNKYGQPYTQTGRRY